jgi:hypothetical protein
MASQQDSASKRIQHAVASLVQNGQADELLELTEELELSPPKNTALVISEQWQALQILACIFANDLYVMACWQTLCCFSLFLPLSFPVSTPSSFDSVWLINL